MELTYDVLLHIFKYLSKFDRLSASETCRLWHEAATNHYFLKKNVIKFYNAILEYEPVTLLKTFEETTIPFCNYHFTDVDITDKFNNFWDKKGDVIRTLTLEECFIREREFVYMLQKCRKLESLRIVKGHVDFDHGGFELNKGLLNNELSFLKILYFSCSIHLTDYILLRLINAAPALKKLAISVYLFDPNLLKKIYFSNPYTPSETVLSFYFFKQLIQSRGVNIQDLEFTNKRFDSEALRTLSEIEHLRLEKLNVRFLSEMIDLTPLTTHQVFLKELSLDSSYHVSDEALTDICLKLENLESLNIRLCNKVTDESLQYLTNLKKLKSLNVACLNKITQNGLIYSICAEVNVTLEELNVACVKLDQNAIIIFSERLPNLRSLNLGQCNKGVTDLTLQFIFKNLLLLEKLNIRYCGDITDAGLTGMKLVAPHENYVEDEFMTHFYQSPKRAKFDEKTVYVGEQKIGTVFCSKRILHTGYSLTRLKHLKEFNIRDCYGISDISLAHAFNLDGLLHLTLDGCDKITLTGLKHLVKNCPTLEYISFLVMDERNPINDDDIKEVVKCLRRLKRLEINECFLRVQTANNEITFIESV